MLLNVSHPLGLQVPPVIMWLPDASWGLLGVLAPPEASWNLMEPHGASWGLPGAPWLLGFLSWGLMAWTSWQGLSGSGILAGATLRGPPVWGLQTGASQLGTFGWCIHAIPP